MPISGQNASTHYTPAKKKKPTTSTVPQKVTRPFNPNIPGGLTDRQYELQQQQARLRQMYAPQMPAPAPLSSTIPSNNYPNPRQFNTTGGPGGSPYNGGTVMPASGQANSSTATGLDQEFTGWAEGLKPDMLIPLMLGNPDAFLRQIMDGMGMDPDQNIGALAAAAPYIQGMNELALVMLGGQDDYEQGDLNRTFNWMGDFASQGMTPGGNGVDFSQGLDNILGSATGGDSLNALASALTNGTPQEQANKMMSLGGRLAEASLHPYWADAFIGELGRQGDAWVSKSAGNDMPGAFHSFFRDRMGY
jgi:hypothetical protein